MSEYRRGTRILATLGPASDAPGVIDALVRAEAIDMAIVAVPADAAQQVVDRLVKAGVRGILNFAPARLRVPGHVALKNVDVTLELEGLAFALNNR